MNLMELKMAIDSAIEDAIDGHFQPEEVEVSIQMDIYGAADVVCTTDVEVFFDCDESASGVVLVGTSGYDEAS
jgi:hypothetical protein